MKHLNWGGLGSTVAASRLIARKEAFTLTLAGDAAMALRAVAGKEARFDRATLAKVVGSLSLTTLPGVMLYALGRAYRISYDSLGDEGLKMKFEVEPPEA